MASGKLMGTVVDLNTEFEALAASAKVSLDAFAEIQKLVYDHLMEYTQKQLLILTASCRQVRSCKI